jgi:hypothetical protein
MIQALDWQLAVDQAPNGALWPSLISEARGPAPLERAPDVPCSHAVVPSVKIRPYRTCSMALFWSAKTLPGVKEDLSPVSLTR